MAKKIIQVPVDEELLHDLDELSRKRQQARAEVIRAACLRYLKQAEMEELDRIYVAGYKRVPEDPAFAEAQAKLLKDVWPEEKW